MSQKREVKSKQFVDENGVIDGSGTPGLIRSNNSKFEANLGDWVEYTDAVQALPEDGVGAAAADLTVERTTFASEILDGTASLKITKANLANARGQGTSLTVPVPKANRAQPHKLSLDFNSAVDFVPANPADPVGTPGDVGIYVLDVTNSKLLVPNQPYITAGKGRYESLVQLPSDCEEARVILHVQSTSTDLWVLFVDNVKLDIASNQTVANSSDWIDFTPTSTWTTNVTHTGRYRQVGDEMEYRVEINCTGAPNASILNINLPDGHVIDDNKINESISTVPQLGYGTALDFGLSNYDIDICYDTSSTVQVLAKLATATYTARTNGTNTVPFTYGANDRIICYFKVPLVGLTSGTTNPASIGLNVQAVMKVTKTNGAMVSNTTIPSWNTPEKDTTGSFNATTGIYTVKSPGDYFVNANLQYTVSAASFIRIYKNGVEVEIGSSDQTASIDNCSVLLPDCVYGDEITMASATSVTAVPGTSGTTLSIHKLGSNAQPYAPRVAYLKDEKAANTAGGTFTSGAWQTRTLNTETGDTSFVSLSTNQFTLQAGTYHIDATTPGYRVDRVVGKLRNITDSTDDIVGTTEGNTGGSAITSDSKINGTITISSAKTFEIQAQCLTTRATDGFGVASNFAVNEVYTQVKITKVL